MSFSQLLKYLILSSVIFIIVGCTYTSSFSPSPYIDKVKLAKYQETKKIQKNIDDIKILKKIPDKNFIVLGTLSAPEVEWTAHYTTADLIYAIKKKALELGADAIINYRKQEVPTNTQVMSYSPYYGGYNYATPVHFKGLSIWGEAIIFVTEQEAKTIEP